MTLRLPTARSASRALPFDRISGSRKPMTKRLEYILSGNAEQLRELSALLNIDTTLLARERNRGLRTVGSQLSYPSASLVRCCQRTWKQKCVPSEELVQITRYETPARIGDWRNLSCSFIHQSSLSKPTSYLLTANSPFGSFLHSGHNHSPAGSFLSPTQVQWNHWYLQLSLSQPTISPKETF